MRWWIGVLMLSLTAVVGLGAIVNPIAIEEMTEVRLAAEAGDPHSQNLLGEAYYHQFEYATAVQWFHKAASAGVTNAQWQLGDMLLSGKTSIKKGMAVDRDPGRGVKWLFAAASQGHSAAQERLGHVYAKGLVGPTNLVEAYKWFARSAERGSLSGRTALNTLVLAMSPEEIAEGKHRVKMPPEQCPVCRNLMDLHTSQENGLRLQGITGYPKKPLALINGKTFAEGEEGTLRVDGKQMTIRCVGIQARSVIVVVDGARFALEL